VDSSLPAVTNDENPFGFREKKASNEVKLDFIEMTAEAAKKSEAF